MSEKEIIERVRWVFEENADDLFGRSANPELVDTVCEFGSALLGLDVPLYNLQELVRRVTKTSELGENMSENKFVIGDYANLEGQLVIVVAEPTEDRVPIMFNGRITWPKKELFQPLTDIQTKAIKVFHMASIYGVVKELEEILRENLESSGLGENYET